jgi:hypothetical protein
MSAESTGLFAILADFCPADLSSTQPWYAELKLPIPCCARGDLRPTLQAGDVHAGRVSGYDFFGVGLNWQGIDICISTRFAG